MESETPFRIALVAIMVATMAAGAYYRLQAAWSGEKISHREEGCLFAAVLRLAGLALAIAALAYVLFPAAVRWASLPLPIWLRWLGVGLGACGALLMRWTLASLGKNLTDTVVVRSQATLVTHGPYRWVRHPFYLTAAVVMLSATMVSASALLGLLSLLVLGLLAIRTPKEEQMLLDRFGDEYRAYKSTTGRFFPRFSR